MRLALIVYSISLILGLLSFGASTGPCGPPMGMFILVPLLFLASTFLLAREVHAWLNGKKHTLLLIIHGVVLSYSIVSCVWFFWRLGE